MQTMMKQTLPTIAEGAKATKSIATFTRLLHEAGLESLLSGEDRYTLFAPIDAAFDDLPPGALRSLEDDPAELRAMVEYHIVSAGREISELRNAKLQTLHGNLLTACVTDDGVRIDHAHTHGHSQRCANGIIHQIDAVLFPGFTPQLSAQALQDSAWSGRRRPSRIAMPVANTPAQDAASLFETPAKSSPEAGAA
jgi:uncharacterized surface protein with fasciclin (FAS1) repeats